MPDPLDPTALLIILPTLLPVSTSSPLPRPTDALAALIHAIHTALDFRLVQPAQAAQPGPSTSSVQVQAEEKEFDDGASETTTAVDQDEVEPTNVENRLGSEWNARGEDSYAFEYRHEQSSLTFRIRVGRMGGRIQVDAMAEDGAPNSISVLITEIINTSAFPIPGSATGSSSNSSSPEAPATVLGFQSIASVSRFIEQYKREIISKILPGLQKDGYVEAPSSSGSGPRNPPPAQPAHNPPPARPDPLMDPFRGARNQEPGHNPASIGHRDLDPLASMQPPGSFNPTGDGGGMYMGPNHPLFAGRRTDPLGEGGQGYHPPGARWDPVGPGVPGNPDGRFPGPGGNPLGGVGMGDDGWGDEMPPPGELGPDLGRLGGQGRGRRRPGGPGGLGGMPGMGPGGFGPRFGGGGGGGGGLGGGFGGGGGMYM